MAEQKTSFMIDAPQKTSDPLAQYEKSRDWRDRLQALIHCQHNARVIADFETRMSAVICEATKGSMSKPYYTEAVMMAVIQDAFNETYDEGYKEGQKDAAYAAK